MIVAIEMVAISTVVLRLLAFVDDAFGGAFFSLQELLIFLFLLLILVLALLRLVL